MSELGSHKPEKHEQFSKTETDRCYGLCLLIPFPGHTV